MSSGEGDEGVNVLVIEDDLGVGAALCESLERHGYATAHVATAAAAEAKAEWAEVVLLDLGLPDLDGVVLCRRLRERTAAPIIIISARAEEIDVVLGLGAGADDYVIKPYGQRELLARIEAVQRRLPTSVGATTVTCGDVSIDQRAHRVTVGSEEIALTRKEYAVLAMLAADAGGVVARDALISAVWGDAWDGASRTLDVHVSTLRHKLKSTTVIENVRGVGYRLRAE